MSKNRYEAKEKYSSLQRKIRISNIQAYKENKQLKHLLIEQSKNVHLMWLFCVLAQQLHGWDQSQLCSAPHGTILFPSLFGTESRFCLSLPLSFLR